MRELALNFGPGARLVGILAEPEPGNRRDDVAVIIVNAGVIHRVGPNRLHVRLSRDLAARGWSAFRIDLPGIGDSASLGLGGSLLEESVAGIRAACNALEQRGAARRFVLAGLCSGADHSFVAACCDARVVGAVLLDPPTLYPTPRHQLLRALRTVRRPIVWWRVLRGRYRLLSALRARLQRPAGSAAAAASERALVAASLRQLVERDVRLFLVVAGLERDTYTYSNQFFDAFPGLGLERTTRVAFYRHAHHTFGQEADRARLLEDVCNWIEAQHFHERPASVAEPARQPSAAGLAIALPR